MQRKRKNDEVDLFISSSCTISTVNCKSIVDTSFPLLKSKIHATTDLNYTTPTNFCCWHCCHNFETNPIPIPDSYDERKDVYNVSGVFCSFSCAKGYLIEQNPYDIGRKSLLFKEMSLHVYKKNTDTIIPAPSRLVLKKFGGSLDIDTFRTVDSQILLETVPFVNIPSHIINRPTFDSEHKWNVRGIQRKKSETTVVEDYGERGLYFDFLKKQQEIDNVKQSPKKKTSQKQKGKSSDLTQFMR